MPAIPNRRRHPNEMTPENRQGWTRSAIALGITAAFIASNFIPGDPVGLKELALVIIGFYFGKQDN